MQKTEWQGEEGDREGERKMYTGENEKEYRKRFCRYL